MDAEALRIYKLIGKIGQNISKAESLDEALEGGIHLIMEGCGADYAVLWYAGADEKKLHPYYWIGPMDFTSKYYEKGKGSAGRVFGTGETVRMLDYKNAPDAVVDAVYGGETIESYLCMPFSNSKEELGCIEFVKTEGSGKFTDEEADICEILTLMAATAIQENENIIPNWKEKKVLISVRGIQKEFVNGDIVTKVLKGVNLDVYEGEFLVLLGESGCGKSTLLNIISGMDSATEGSIVFDGMDLTGASESELTAFRRDNIGFIFQSYNLMPNLNAVQNLELIGELVENPLDAAEALKLVDLENRKDNYPSQLSGGQQQRVSIARALIKRPKLIIADEPTAALDYATSIEVLSVMEKIVGQGSTLVMVTHNEEITRMADRVVRMRNGKSYEVRINKRPVPASELVW